MAPALVWARILRNVEQGYKRQGSIREAWFFRSLAGGLHPEEVKMRTLALQDLRTEVTTTLRSTAHYQSNGCV